MAIGELIRVTHGSAKGRAVNSIHRRWQQSVALARFVSSRTHCLHHALVLGSDRRVPPNDT